MIYYCYQCGEKMRKKDRNNLICSQCKHTVNIADYGYESYFEEGFPYEEESEPQCCQMCGGPYPDCLEDCKVFNF